MDKAGEVAPFPLSERPLRSHRFSPAHRASRDMSVSLAEVGGRGWRTDLRVGPPSVSMGTSCAAASTMACTRLSTGWSARSPKACDPAPATFDLTLYSLRKFVRLALAGNPSILLLLFRRGEVDFSQALRLIDEAEARLRACKPPRDEPDRARIERWLVATHLATWNARAI